jgi:hypothetical protein
MHTPNRLPESRRHRVPRRWAYPLPRNRSDEAGWFLNVGESSPLGVRNDIIRVVGVGAL